VTDEEAATGTVRVDAAVVALFIIAATFAARRENTEDIIAVFYFF